MNRIVLLASAFILLQCIAPAQQVNKEAVDFTSSDLPVFIINTNGKTIADEPKVTVDMSVIYNGAGKRNYITDIPNNFNGKVGIEIRGSSSQFMFPKKQYSIEIIDSAGEDLDSSLLGLPAESDWILSAPYTDKTLMRDELVYQLFAGMGHYAPRFRYCELVINKQYQGVYVLIEKIKRNKKRVNITKLPLTDSTGADLTGGYIIKIDKDEGSRNAGWRSSIPPYPGAWQKIYYQYDTPDPKKITPLQKKYIQDYITAFENAMNSSNYADTATGYPAYIDVDCFADYILVDELSKNVDSYRLSTFLYKDKDSKGGKLHAGPVWDYNLAFGNANYNGASSSTGFFIDYLATSQGIRNDEFQMPSWFKKLFDEPGFRSVLSARWTELRQKQFSLDSIYRQIDSLVLIVNEAKERNFAKWPVLNTYVWPNVYIGKTYNDELDYMKTWIKNRINWLDTQLLQPSSAGKDITPAADFSLWQNYPNPFNPETNIKFRIPVRQHVTLKIYDIMGKEISTLIDEEKPAGEYQALFNGAGLASGTYFYRMVSGAFSMARKLIILK